MLGDTMGTRMVIICNCHNLSSVMIFAYSDCTESMISPGYANFMYMKTFFYFLFFFTFNFTFNVQISFK